MAASESCKGKNHNIQGNSNHCIALIHLVHIEGWLCCALVHGPGWGAAFRLDTKTYFVLFVCKLNVHWSFINFCFQWNSDCSLVFWCLCSRYCLCSAIYSFKFCKEAQSEGYEYIWLCLVPGFCCCSLTSVWNIELLWLRIDHLPHFCLNSVKAESCVSYLYKMTRCTTR